MRFSVIKRVFYSILVLIYSVFYFKLSCCSRIIIRFTCNFLRKNRFQTTINCGVFCLHNHCTLSELSLLRAWSFSISRIENTLSGAKAKRKHFEVGVWVFRKHLNIFYLKSRENILQNPIQPLHCTFRNQPNLAAFFIINAF